MNKHCEGKLTFKFFFFHFFPPHFSIFWGVKFLIACLLLECTHLNNRIALERGICHNDTLRLEFMVCPSYFKTNFAIISNKTTSSNTDYIFSCERLNNGNIVCSPGNEWEYNETSNILYYDFTFNHILHAGRFLRIRTNTSCAAEDVQFYPLRQRSKFRGI